MAELVIRSVAPNDAAAIAEIYNYYVRHTTITFEETDVTAEGMAVRIAAASATHPWLVGTLNGQVVGYAYARKYHERAAYRHTVETAIYLQDTRRGTGVGKPLYAALLDTLKAGEVHALIGSIALPNEASVRLHEKFGFRLAAEYPQIGFKFGQWIDVACFHRFLGTS
jgi:phosphinothricin acetyltransferase